MKRLFYALTLLSYSCTPTSSPQDSDDITTIKEDLIYIASRGNGFDLYTYDLATEQESSFAHAQGWEWSPQFIAGKSIVVYNSQDTSGNFQLRVADLDGNPVKQALPDLPNLLLSPDGKWIVYTRSEDDVSRLFLASLTNLSDSLLITPDSAYHGRAKWSYDSKQLAFVSDRSGKNEVYSYTLEDKSIEQLTDNDQREKYLSWSPDGRHLATTLRTDSTENEIALINLTNREVNVITQTAINESELAWSPSGRYIAYHAKVDEADDIFLLEVATGEVKKVTKGEGYHGEPGWIRRE